MRGWIDWARKYPMTMLLIICCLIGGPYFAGQRVIEAYKNYTGKAMAADVLGTWTQKAAEHPTLLKADAQGTKEQQAAKKADRLRMWIRVIWMMRCLSVIPERIH